MCDCGILHGAMSWSAVYDCGIPHGAMSWYAVCERGISSDCDISLVVP